jgi:hypothetical protein
VLERVRTEYERHARDLERELSPEDDGVDSRELDRRLRLGLLDSKRSAVIALRDTNQIDDIVLREIQAVLDIEEIRLLGPSTPG